MIIYEVNLVVQPDVADKYAVWLGEHIRQILGFDGFLRAEWSEEFLDDTDDAKRWVVHYFLRDRESFDRYLAEHAPAMRREGIERFGDRFTATRRVLEVREEIDR